MRGQWYPPCGLFTLYWLWGTIESYSEHKCHSGPKPNIAAHNWSTSRLSSKPLYSHLPMKVLLWDLCMRSHFSCVQLFATPWAIACQAPLSMGFSGKNTGVGCCSLLQRIFPTQGLNPGLLCLLQWQALTTSATWEALLWDPRAPVLQNNMFSYCWFCIRK